jgi:lipopolysaccharide heptosyltransferase I
MDSAIELPAPGIQRLLIVRLSSMGDIIHTLPAATALRQAFPQATVGWIVEERWRELLCTLQNPLSGPRGVQRPLADKVHIVNTAAWRKAPFSSRTWVEVASGMSELRGVKYEVAVDFQGAVRSAVLARLSRAPTILGFAQPRENAASMWYTRQMVPTGAHIIEQNLSLAASLARRPLAVPNVDFPCDPAVEQKIEQWLLKAGIRSFVILNPGAGWGAKQWPAERYGYVAKRLGEQGLRSLINFGPGEQDLASAAEAASGHKAELISCSLSELIALTRRARLFVGGDTGPMHLAAALGVPVVAIFGPTNPARNGPFGTQSIVLRNKTSPTSHTRRPEPDAGLLAITSADVALAAIQLLERTGG